MYRVGLEPDPNEWVALIRFDVVVDGRALHGLLRGPADAAVFTLHENAEGAPAGSRRGHRRGRVGRLDDHDRHRRFGLA